MTGLATATAEVEADESHRPACANCAAPLQGRYCHACGQDSHTHKRSILHLGFEVIEGLFHLDGRLLNTLPNLFFRPGLLARDYIDGRLARHMPPFRTFLVALVAFIFAAEFAAHRNMVENERAAEARVEALKTPQGRQAEAARLRKEAADERAESLKESADDRQADLKDGDAAVKVQARYAREVANAEARYAQTMLKADRVERGLPEPPKVETKRSKPRPWWATALKKAVQTPEYFWTLMFNWSHQLAVLLLPIVGLALGAVYRNRPQIYLYDHLQVAMNLMAFSFFANAAALLPPPPVTFWTLGAVALWTPVNLYQTLRWGYGSSWLGATLKTLIVWLATVTAFLALVTVITLISLAQLQA